MKTIQYFLLTVLALIAVASTDASARSRKPMPSERWTLRLGYGRSSEINTDNFTQGAGRYHYNGYDRLYSNSLENYYSNYNDVTYATGVFTLSADYRVSRRSAFGLSLGIDSHWSNIMDYKDHTRMGRNEGLSICAIPYYRFFWISAKSFRMYSGIGVGAAKCFGYPYLKYSYETDGGVRRSVDDTVQPAAQLFPLGMEFGSGDFGAFVEFGNGYLYSGVNLGVTYRF